jgi:hypothetical protein
LNASRQLLKGESAFGEADLVYRALRFGVPRDNGFRIGAVSGAGFVFDNDLANMVFDTL